MTSQDLRSELEKQPFVPLRVHLVIGKTSLIPFPGAAWLLQNTILILRNTRNGRDAGEGYDVVSLRSIERIETLDRPSRRRAG